MAMAYSLVIKPGDEEAEERYAQYRHYSKLTGPAARFNAWSYEPDVWIMSVASLFLCCGWGDVAWWTGAPVGFLLAVYWLWAYQREPRVKRRFERLLRQRRILKVPRFLVAAVDREATRLGLTDWGEYPVRRFALLHSTLLEVDHPWLLELRNDCGCRKACGHTNRVSRRQREAVRRRIRTIALGKLELVSCHYGAALEANKLRNKHIRDALGATAQEDG